MQTAPSPALVQYWDSEAVPASIAALCETFRERNPDFSHRLCSEAGAERLIAERFGARELAAFRACAVPTMQSDYFRYCAVLALGGVYADADFECLRALRPLLDHGAKGTIFLGGGKPRMLRGALDRPIHGVWNGFFAFPKPGSPLLTLTLEIATASIETRLVERVWPAGGEKAGPNMAKSIIFSVGPGIFTLLRLMDLAGGFDPVRKQLAGAAAEPIVKHYCEVIGDYSRVVDAFEGVRIVPMRELLRWVRHPSTAPAYKDTDAYWHRWHRRETPIFR